MIVGLRYTNEDSGWLFPYVWLCSMVESIIPETREFTLVLDSTTRHSEPHRGNQNYPALVGQCSGWEVMDIHCPRTEKASLCPYRMAMSTL